MQAEGVKLNEVNCFIEKLGKTVLLWADFAESG